MEWGLGPVKSTYSKIPESTVFQIFHVVLVSQGPCSKQFSSTMYYREFMHLLPFFGYNVQLWSEFFILQVLFINNKIPHTRCYCEISSTAKKRTNEKRSHLCSIFSEFEKFWDKHHVLHLRDQLWRLLSQISRTTWYSEFWKITALHNIIINWPTVQPYGK